jgi:tRNA1Val (adenine37-N6)-methyltransferase
MKFFNFKQFRISDDRSAMKVGTDSVLLGAWIQDKVFENILDIGCGSGLISLMMAQRFENSNVMGIEIDSNSVEDAKFNFEQSIWASRLKVREIDIRKFNSINKYDLVISNPPFFTESLLPPMDNRAGARHDFQLSLDDLLMSAVRLLKENAVFALVFPYDREEILIEKASQLNLYPQRILHTRNKPDAQVKRCFIEFQKKQASEVKMEILEIRDYNNEYSSAYKKLTKDFYINF